MAEHKPDCRWQRTTDAECEYRETHHYCPHAEHACDCHSHSATGPLTAAELAVAHRWLAEHEGHPPGATALGAVIIRRLLAAAATQETR